jgi:hypothetical protein
VNDSNLLKGGVFVLKKALQYHFAIAIAKSQSFVVGVVDAAVTQRHRISVTGSAAAFLLMSQPTTVTSILASGPWVQNA